jgi:uncharacterized protein (DUF58 family)
MSSPEQRSRTWADTDADADLTDQPLPLVWRPTLRAVRLLSIAVVAMVGAVLLHHAYLVALAAPAVLLLAVPVARRPTRARVTREIDNERSLEGDQFTVTVRVDADREFGWLEAETLPGLGVRIDDVRIDGASVHVTMTAQRWGRWLLGVIELYPHDAAGLLRASLRVPLGEVRVFPIASPATITLLPARLPNWIGGHAARLPGEGLELIGVRPYVVGDRQRRINWPATTRRGRIQLNQFAAERAVDVVMMIDAFSDIGPPGESTLDRAVRGAVGLARQYLRAHDRVGLVSVGGSMRWLTAATGRTHVYRIADAVMDVRRDFGYSALSLDRLPRQVIPANALVFLFSPLRNLRILEALRDLCEAGFAVVVIETLCPEPAIDQHDLTDTLALRLWRLDNEAVRFTLRELGVPILPWNGTDPLDAPLAPFAHQPVFGRQR